ncbi:MAG: polyprenyl diphosphate synthase [Bacillales bacterium]|nr:polyprenyl diphosphate synthase [Bacillales bacterium]MDY6002922.1 polyprenyl diphosphate synthase [Bacilli bacterium]
MGKIIKNVTLTKPLNHIAFIMDGNGRWASSRGLPRHLGHKEACNRIIEVFNLCKAYNIKVMSFYAFSTENWKRPKREINHLFVYLEHFFKKEIKTLIKDEVRVVISGDITRLPLKTQQTCNNAIELTKDFDKYVFNICLNYGGQDEIIKATKEIALLIKNNEIDIDDIDKKLFENHLYTKGLPPVDLMIRTSNEYRLSNFLLWQNAYAEFVFTPVHWPDFKQAAFEECLSIYNERNRRFGGLTNDK